MAGTRRTYVKRISIGRPITSINQAASGVVSGAVRSAGQILINDANTNLFQAGDILGSHGINTYFDSIGRNIVLSVDSDDIKSIVDSNYNALVSSSPFVDSAYVEQNSLDSERTLALLDSELQNWTTSLIPYYDSQLDLGSPTKKWRRLYLSGNTIVLGGLTIGDEDTTFAIRDSAGNIAAYNLSGNTTDDLAEGSNLYYTRARFDSALGDTTSSAQIRTYFDSALAESLSQSTIRSYFSSVDSGGDGAFSYDSTNGVFTYRGPSAAEVRAHFSAGGDLTYDSATGRFEFDVEQVYTQANFESDLSQSVAGGTGITYDSSSQTISITNTGVIAGEYGSATEVPIITVNAQGQIDSIGEILVAGVTAVAWDSSVEQLTISTADGGSFVATINGFNNLQADSASITNVSGTSANYGTINATTGTISQLSTDSAVIGIIDNNTLRTNDLDADSGVVTDISGTTLNYSTGRISQLTSDSASITTIDNNVLRTNDLSADSGIVTNISGSDLNYGTGNFTSATAAGLTVNGVSNLDSTNIDGSLYVTGDLTVQGTTTTVNSTTVTINDKNIVVADSAADLTALNGAGFTMGGANIATPPEMKYVTTGNLINFNRALDVDGHLNADSATFVNLNVTGLSTTTISRAATVDSGTYGSTTLIPVITVNTSGFIDSIGEVAVAGVSSVSWDSTNEQLTINTADGGSFVTTINGFNNLQADSATITNIAGTDVNYGTGRISQLTSDSASILTIDNNILRTNDLSADSGVVTNISGTDLNYGTGRISQLTSDSASILTIDNNILRTNDLNADSAIITNISGSSLNYDSAQISQLTVDSGTFTTLAINGRTIDSDWVTSFAKNFEGDITITTSQDDAAAGPNLILYRNSASPADSDIIGQIEFKGEDDSGNTQEYAKIRGVIIDGSGDSEDGAIETFVLDGGAYTAATRISRNGFEILNSIDLDLSGQFYIGGEAVDSNWVAERARVITHPEFKLIDAADSSAFGPKLILDRNSASPSDSDDIGYIEFRGRNSVDSEIEYGSIRAFIEDVSADSEDGRIQFHLKQAGFDREKLALTKDGVVLAHNERLYFRSDSGSNYLSGTFTASHNLLLPDSSGTILTRDFVTTLIDSNYIGARQSATGLTLDVKNRDSDITAITITQAAIVSTGAPIGFGNTVNVLLEDSSDFTISL